MAVTVSIGSAGILLIGVCVGLFLGRFYDFSAGVVQPKSAAEPLERATAFEAHRSNFTPSIDVAEAAGSSGGCRVGPTRSPIEECIPPRLRREYGPNSTTFEVTRSMLRRSRPVVGNSRRLRAYLRKLRSGRCTVVLILGGSVTAGHNVKGGEANAYPRLFMDFLNERYPCGEKDGAAGRHELKTTQMATSQTHMTAWTMVEGLESFDLVLVEFNINDNFISDLPHALEDKGPLGETVEYISLWYMEVVLRRLLRMKKPDHPAIITFNADYVGRKWANPPHFEPAMARKTLFRSNQEPLKLWISSMYEIPVFSAVMWMLPLAGKFGADMQFQDNWREGNPYSTSAWHVDRCCHPRREGHKILNLVLAYNIVEEEKLMMTSSEGGGDEARVERDFTADHPPIMRDPIYLSPQEEALYVEGSLQYGGVDFTDPVGEGSWRDAIAANDGWTWFADNEDGDKFGYIAEGSSGGQHVAISLTGGMHGVVEVSYVVSYENFGIALAWLTDSMRNDKKEECGQGVDNIRKERRGQPNRLFAIWDERASVPKVQLLDVRLDENESKILHVCLTPPGAKQQGEKNTFKLLRVRVY